MTTEKANRAETRSFIHKMENAVVYTKKKIEEAQARQQAQANKKRRAIDFDVGDKVYVIKKGWRTIRLSDKLDTPVAGPWKILKKVGHSFKVQLPPRYKLHPVFHADRLRKNPDSPLLGQHNKPENTQEVNNELE